MKVFVCPNRNELGKFQCVVRAFPKIWNGTILDVGCSSQSIKQVLLKLNNKFIYVGIDLFPPADIIADIESLPFRNKKFDIVVALDVLEHANNIHKAFSEICRVSRKFVVLTLPNIYEIKSRIKFLLGLKLSGKFGLPEHPTMDRHRWFFSMKDALSFVHTMAHKHGFNIITEGCLIGPRRGFWIMRKVVGLVPNLLSPSYIVLIAKVTG